MKRTFACLILALSIITTIEASHIQADFSKNHASWIRECQDNRVYLKANRVILSDEGIYVLDDSNNEIKLLEVHSDSNGIYTKLESMERLERRYELAWCHTCRTVRGLTKEGKCSKCGNPP